jgi:hypothetical protein
LTLTDLAAVAYPRARVYRWLSQRAEARMSQFPSVMYDAGHWRDRADEARRMAVEIKDLAARDAMLQVAVGYDRLAERASVRKAKQPA